MEANNYLALILWHKGPRFVIARRPQADVAISGRQLRFRRKCPVIHPGSARLHPKGTSSRFAPRAPRRFAPRNDTSGWCGGAPAPLRGLIALYRALTERRYRPRRNRFHFNDSLCVSTALRREGHAPPLQWRVRSTMVPGNLQLPMAVTTRKGHAASVRRQSRQRLRSDRRYRRNRCIPF